MILKYACVLWMEWMEWILRLLTSHVGVLDRMLNEGRVLMVMLQTDRQTNYAQFLAQRLPCSTGPLITIL